MLADYLQVGHEGQATSGEGLATLGFVAGSRIVGNHHPKNLLSHHLLQTSSLTCECSREQNSLSIAIGGVLS